MPGKGFLTVREGWEWAWRERFGWSFSRLGHGGHFPGVDEGYLSYFGKDVNPRNCGGVALAVMDTAAGCLNWPSMKCLMMLTGSIFGSVHYWDSDIR
jgi:hypothetical protein